MTGAEGNDNRDGDTEAAATPSRSPSPSPWAGARPMASGVEPPTGGDAAYQPPGGYERPAPWNGPSAYQSAASPTASPYDGATRPPAGGRPAPGPLGPPPDPEPDRFEPEDLLRLRDPAPTSGVRRVVYRLSGGHLNLGPSGRDQARQRLIDRAKTPAVTGRRRIAMVSLKGGVGKTTTTVMLGHTLATVRGDNVIAVDANPDAGNLASRVRRETDRSARDLLNASGTLQRYADVRSFTSQAESRLEVLAGESDPALSEAFSASDYEAVLTALERFYSIVLTDCGTGILHDAMRAVLWYVDQLIVVTSPAIDSAHALGQLLDWLDQHGYHHLVESGIVVVNGVRKRSQIRVEQFAATFGARCRGVVTIPYDASLAPGGESSLEAMAPATRQAYLELAATVGDDFSQPRLHGHDPGIQG